MRRRNTPRRYAIAGIDERPSGSAQLGHKRPLLVPMIVASTCGVLNSQLR